MRINDNRVGWRKKSKLSQQLNQSGKLEILCVLREGLLR